MKNKEIYLGIDIGGSWLKVVSVDFPVLTGLKSISEGILAKPVSRVRSRLGEQASVDDFMVALNELLSLVLDGNDKVMGIGISTAGVVDYKGENLIIAAPHLSALKDKSWINYLKQRFQAPVTLMNDADAAAVGAAARGYLQGFHTIGIMPVGTGIGFSLWRNGRKWNPNQMLPLLGCVMTPDGSYDQIAGVSSIAEYAGHDLSLIFSDSQYEEVRCRYEKALADVIYTACVLYHTDIILMGGGLAEALKTIHYPLEDILQEKVRDALSSLKKEVQIKVMHEGNSLPLIGAVLLAMGESIAQSATKSGKTYSQINTEIPYDETLNLHTMNASGIVELLYKAEEEAGLKLKESLEDISEVAVRVAESLQKGGRLIYVGAGTSGRLAAIDTVELACTFGFPRERVYTLIAGGLSDAAIDIESHFEEDASSIPELLLTSVDEQDAVIGISVSGSAYYVQSALAYSKSVGAYTVFIQESASVPVSYCDKMISLHSGHELVAGSTRMKAGTATKKVLNFISTTAMILQGRVHGCYMVEVECLNQKLISRAQNILYKLFGLNDREALELLKKNNLNLRQAIKEITK
ncbi:MAG: N-acetylmuramic acid 6-phosphate etherase [Bacteroidales bacterium]|jgi:N-acetylmuramic acid 6-phosphate etherase|nr:N-acetylmuramic acid 6-phosphate etherase [Bacteroidales bacterium]